MASSSLPETWACMNMDVSDSNMSNALIMSLWEETQADQEHDEERLRSLIRALEVELDPTTSTTDHGHHDMFMDVTNDPQFGSSNSADNFQLPSDVGYANGGDRSASGFGWIDMEKGSSSQGDEPIDNSWYLNCDFDEVDCMPSNFGGPQSTAPFEEHGHQNVWQEACNTRMLV